MDTSKDYYRILGVSPNVEPEALKAVYRALAKKYHPDTTSGTSTSEIFRDIQEAYGVLSDPELRKSYDREIFEDIETEEEFDEDPVSEEEEVFDAEPVKPSANDSDGDSLSGIEWMLVIGLAGGLAIIVGRLIVKAIGG